VQIEKDNDILHKELATVYARYEENQWHELDLQDIEKISRALDGDLYLGPRQGSRKFHESWCIDGKACLQVLELDEREQRANKAADELF
jgi:hypothetical protein